jgi:alkylation response protein AidB-like acyl-CoA dehydrogenase
MSYLIPRRELDFLLYDWLDIEGTLPATDGDEFSRDIVDGLLDLSERLATDHFLPHYRSADIEEPQLVDGQVHIHPEIRAALAKYRELGLFGASHAAELGGMGLPAVVCLASFVQFLAANLSTSAYIVLTMANARVISAFGSPEQVQKFAVPQIEGRWLGTMCLSEPQAGSGLGDILTRAVPDGEDELGRRYRITGNKMWISGADHDASENIVHLVLAKVPGSDGVLAPGTKGISLFIVPKILPDGTRNDVAVASLNHKMGYHGTTNAAFNLGENGGATGWIVGAEGDGLRQMFMMMNEARISIGLGATAASWRGYRHALEYARERTQGRVAGEGGERAAPIIRHADVRHMLMAQKAYSEGALALCLYCARLVDQAEDAANGEAGPLLDLLTPVAKTWPSEFGLAANDLAIQVHGGYGYTRDFPVEQIYRDNRLNPIHEGTTGIQGIDLVGRKILKDNGQGLALFMARARATAARAAQDEALASHGDALLLALDNVEAAAARLVGLGAVRALDNATSFLRGFGHVVVAWLMLDMALAAAPLAGDGEYGDGKRLSCRYFFETEMPRAQAWLDFSGSGSDVAMAMPESAF